MPSSAVQRLLAFARELQQADTFVQLLASTRAELDVALGYSHAWLFVAETEEVKEMRLIDSAGSTRDDVWEVAPVLKVDGDAMLEEIVRSDAPVVVDDARTDPRTNKEIVRQLDNRTIVTVPLRLLDRPFGAFGTGTFGDEGCRPPTEEQLDYLVGMGSQLAVAAGRIRFHEERRRAAAILARTEEQLRHAQKMEAVGRLAGGIAHDFNNILTVILTYSSRLLEAPALGESTHDEIEQIRLAGQRAADLTQQLLAFSRQQMVTPRSIDLNAVITEMSDMIIRLVGEDVDVAVLPQEQLGRIEADRSHVDQVLMNLVVNARDAMPGGGRITIETGNVELDETYARDHFGVEPGPHVMLAVSDTGVGMDRATCERIFEPFFTTKETGKGTGLGLSTVYGIVKQSGGHVGVYSEPGKGSTFTIYLPRTEALPEAPPDPPRDVAALTGSETILLTEDDDQVRQAIGDTLRAYGYRVLAARSPREACSLCDQEPAVIHLLLTDVVMPEMTGPRLAERVREGRPSIIVLYMSGYTANAIAHRGFLDPGLPLLHKPITPEALLRAVRGMLT